MSESLLSRSKFVSKLLKSKAFRDRYVYEHVRNGIPFQIRALRNQREWTQADLGEASGKPRPVISRLEDPNYGKLSLKTLLDIASAFEVALLVKFVPFSRLVKEYQDVSWQALGAKSVTDREERVRLDAWAAQEHIDRTPELRALSEPVSTSVVQHTLAFSSPTLVEHQNENSTSSQPVAQPATRAIAA